MQNENNCAKCNLNAINWKLIHEKKTKTRVQGTTWKEQMSLPNIHLSKGKYSQSSKEFKMLVPYLI